MSNTLIKETQAEEAGSTQGAAMSDQLLPCPFCGRTASIQEMKDNDLFYCSYCGCEGPRPYDIGICTQENCTTECVVEAWNTRRDSFKTEHS